MTAKTERTLAERAGHLEMLGGRKGSKGVEKKEVKEGKGKGKSKSGVGKGG